MSSVTATWKPESSPSFLTCGGPAASTAIETAASVSNDMTEGIIARRCASARIRPRPATAAAGVDVGPVPDCDEAPADLEPSVPA